MKLINFLLILIFPIFSYAQQNAFASSNIKTSNVFGDKSYVENTVDTEFSEEEEIGTNGFSFQVYDAGINTKYSEYGSTFFMNKFIMFSSRKLGAFGSGKNEGSDEYSSTLFCTDINKNGSLQRPLLFSRFLNNKENQGTVAFTPDEKVVYFTESSRENHEIYHLFKMVMDPEHLGQWINKEKIEFASNEFSIENPHVTADGKTLYFASNMPGTTGGFDIFSATINEDGSLGKPQPVKGAINTKFDEKYPFTSKSGKHLYFSSTGHRSLGGYDVFVSRVVKGEHNTPINLGTTLNSRYDDISFIPASKTKGYLTSNRSEGQGGFDVYKTDLYSVNQSVSGKVMDLETNLPIANSVVKLYDQDGTEVASTVTDEKATFKFNVAPFEIYTIVAENEEFETQTKQLKVYNANKENFTQNFLLAPRTSSIVEKDNKLMIAVDNIYFDYDKSSIKSESVKTLDKIAAILTAHPHIKLNIDAHTDSQGTEEYNMELSQRRAGSTKAYLMGKGIAEDRLVSTGYGMSKPLIDCTNCSEEEHSQNRRIEFIIVQ